MNIFQVIALLINTPAILNGGHLFYILMKFTDCIQYYFSSLYFQTPEIFSISNPGCHSP